MLQEKYIKTYLTLDEIGKECFHPVDILNFIVLV